MAAEVRYAGGPNIQSETNEWAARGDAVMWVRVGSSDRLRPVILTTGQMTHLAYKCLEILNQRRQK